MAAHLYSRMHRASLLIMCFRFLLVFSAAKIGAHIGNGTIQKCGKLGAFRFCKALHQPAFYVLHGVVHSFSALLPFGQNVDPLTAAICFVRAKLDKALLFHAAEQARNGGMTQMKCFFNIPGAGRCIPQHQHTQNAPLCSGQLHVRQSVGHGIVGTPVQNVNPVTIMFFSR